MIPEIPGNPQTPSNPAFKSYLSSPQLAQPPALEVAGVRFDHGQDVPLPEGQLVRAFGDVIVDGLGQQFLERGEKEKKNSENWVLGGNKVDCAKNTLISDHFATGYFDVE